MKILISTFLVATLYIFTACQSVDKDTSNSDLTPSSNIENIGPVIILECSENMEILQYTIFEDPGATAIDAIDKNIDIFVYGSVDSDLLGEYNLKYVAENSAGKIATKTRKVEVVNYQKAIYIKKTGQIESYDNNGLLKRSGELKDDGYYRSGIPVVYEVFDQNIIIDKTAQLSWHIKENIFAKSAQDGIGYCELVTSGGHSDWRLPSIKELQTINNTTAFKSLDANTSYWSSTLLHNNSRLSWVYSLSNYATTTSKIDGNLSVICVRNNAQNGGTDE